MALSGNNGDQRKSSSLWRSKLGKDYDQAFIQKNETKFKRQIDKLRQLPENRICADCHHPHNPTVWASVNLGVFLCLRCGSIHRGLGTHISKPKGCTGSYLWGPDEIERMALIGNQRAKELYEEQTNHHHGCPLPNANDEIWRHYIREKYENHQSLVSTPLPAIQPTTITKTADNNIGVRSTKMSASSRSRETNGEINVLNTKMTKMKVEADLLSFEEAVVDSRSTSSNTTKNAPKTSSLAVQQPTNLISFHDDGSTFGQKDSTFHSEVTTKLPSNQVDFFAQFGL